jgi:hypothetical protein
MNFKTLLTATALTAVCGAANAQDVGDITVGAGLSNFGINLEGAYQVTPDFRARGALMGGFSDDFEDADDGDSIEGEFNLGGAALLADYYPLQNGWRVSGGLFISNTDLEATGTVALDGEPDSEATVTAEFKNTIAPMITTGYDLGFGEGWAFTSEVGVIFSGGIDVEYKAANADDQADIDADEEVQDAIDTAGDLSAIPYLSIGVSYKY